jgi:hypothetical protein
MVSQLTAVVKGNQTKLFALDTKGNVIRYDWITGTWVQYKKAD